MKQFKNNNDRMFKAVCANCGKTCEVPFRPNGKKPVYCQDCFAKNAPSNDGFARKEFSPKPSYHSPAPFRPRESNHENEGLKRSLDSISMKLDKLVRILEAKAEVPRAQTESETAPKVSKKKAVAPKKASKKK